MTGLGPVGFLNVLRFLRNVHHFRDGHLHAERQFILIDAGQRFGIADGLQFEFIQLFERIEAAASDIAIQAEQLKYIKDLLAERIAHHTGQTKDQINADSDRDRWFTAEGAKDYGIIDHVIVRRGEMR